LRRLTDLKNVVARKPAAAAGVILAALYVAVLAVKLYHWAPGTYFTSDPAFRFRYMRTFAAGEKVPRLDRPAQWPEGVDTGRSFFLTQDAFIGLSYRLLRPVIRGTHPQNFLRWHVSIWSSLSLLLVYFWARRAFGSRAGALLAAAVYAFALPIYIRTCGNYLREDFVLPILFFALYCQLRVLQGGGWRWALPAAASFALALVSWHASSFLYFFAVLPLAAAAVTSAEAKNVARAAGALVAAALVAYLHPALREKAFLASPSFALACAVTAAALVASRRRLRWWQRLAALGALFAVAFGLGRPFAAAGEYSHIYLMIFYKIRYLGVKPADPTALPLAAREIWAGPANSPSLPAAAVLLGAPLAIAAAPLVRNIKKFARGFAAPAGSFGAATLAFFILFGLLYAGYNRFSVVFVFFVAVCAAGYIGLASSRRALAWLLIPAVLLPLEAVKAFRYEDRPWPWTGLLKAAAESESGYATNVGDEEWRVVRWFGNQPERAEAAVLAPIAASATLLTYAGTPIVLHPIYEAPGMRAKVDECWRAIFRGEEDFYRVCEKYDVSYVAYHAAFIMNRGPDSIRYARAVTEVKADSCAYLMQFEPARLRHFAPVFETVSWRVFLVGVPGREAPAHGPASPLFTGPVEARGLFDEGRTARAYARVDEAVTLYNEGVEYYDGNDFDAARAKFSRALELCPRLVGAWDALAWLELEAGNPAAAARAVERAFSLDPYDDAASNVLATLRGEGQ
jgi:tetratricopeptide (TPR) repeat protein